MPKITQAERDELIAALEKLTPSQHEWVKAAILGFGSDRKFSRLNNSDIVTDMVLEGLGDRLVAHHANSRQSLSKDRFEFALEATLNAAEIPAQLSDSRTFRGRDIVIAGVPVSLKTEAARGIKEDTIHVSKWMELGKGAWELPLLRDLFLEHLQGYERVFTFRCLSTAQERVIYELVEIPKALLLEAKHCVLEVRQDSRQNPKPGYGYVNDADGRQKYALYFDGGTERKLQIKSLRKDLCTIHARWEFGSAALG